MCNFQTGICTCYGSFFGANCAIFSPTASSSAKAVSSSDILALETTKSGFSASVLRLSSTNAGSSAFNMISVQDNFRTIFTLGKSFFFL